MARTEKMVRIYHRSSADQRDAKRLARSGWFPIHTVERRPRAGCIRILFLWWLVLLRPPKPELVVTYQRIKNDSGFARYPRAMLARQLGLRASVEQSDSPVSLIK